MEIQTNPALENLIDNGYDVNIKKYVYDGFDLWKSQISGYAMFTSIYMCIAVLATYNQGLSLCTQIFVLPCLIAGLILVINNNIRGQISNFPDFFNGFKLFYPMVVLTILYNLAIALGTLCLVIPGIYLLIAYYFANMFVVLLNMDVKTAMNYSRRIVHKNWGKMFLLILVATLIGLSGILIFVIGVIFTFPLMYCILFTAFDDIVGNAIRKQNENKGIKYLDE